VPTPFHKDVDHTPDLSYVLAAAGSVAKVLKAGDTIILESTSPVGTTEQLRDAIAAQRPDLALPGLTHGTPDVAIAYCPERVLPGRILEELTHNDRSIGGITPRCARKALGFYKRFVRGTCITTDAQIAVHKASIIRVTGKTVVDGREVPTGRLLRREDPPDSDDINEWVYAHGGYPTKGVKIIPVKDARQFWPMCK